MSKYYKTEYDARQITGEGEKNEEPSMTIEGESTDIRKVVEQARQGLPTGFEETHPFFLDAPIETIDHMHRQGLDLTDIQRHQESLLDRYEQLEEQRKQLEAEKEEKTYGKTTDDTPTDEAEPEPKPEPENTED